LSDAVVPIRIEVAEHFHEAEQQRHAAMFGMWIWLATELLLFSGLFLNAMVLRVMYPASVTAVALHLKYWIGATNTAVLIFSSLTMSGAIEASRRGWHRPMIRFMLATAGLGVLFLGLKGYEYWCDYVEHMIPFFGWRPYELAGDRASQLFINTYFLITGLHALHLTTGISVLLGLAWLMRRAEYLSRHQNRVEVFGLFWHFIDLIWMIVFPILYLLNR
jgi:cytochrome c oxidase subunit III